MVFHLLHREKEAITSLEKAKALLAANHHFSDIYCKMPDEVFIEDIEGAIHRIKKR